MGPSVHEVAHEQIICVWALSAHLEQLFKVIELTVNIPANLKFENRIRKTLEK